MARKTKKFVPLTMEDRKQELIKEFDRVTSYTLTEIESIYSFGEPDFDPTAAQENAGMGVIGHYAKLTGLSWDEAIKEVQIGAWGFTNYKG